MAARWTRGHAAAQLRRYVLKHPDPNADDAATAIPRHMHPRTGKSLIERIFRLDPDAEIDTAAPPGGQPFSVIFSPHALLDDDHLRRLAWLLRQLEYLNLANTNVTDAGLLYLKTSMSLKVLTVPFGTQCDTILTLLSIPSLHRLRMPMASLIPECYRALEESGHLATNHFTFVPKRPITKTEMMELYPTVWKQLGWI